MSLYTTHELTEALRATSSIINKCEKAQEKFPEGNSHHTLLRRRLDAMYISRELISAELEIRAEPDYTLLAAQMRELCSADAFYVPLMANVSALLWQALPNINWAGFYVLRGGALVLGPFQGKAACIRIEVGKGVCGAAVKDDCVQRVADVHACPGHIAGDSASNSEIVLPIHSGGRVAAVLDIDSPLFDRFTESDELGLRSLVSMPRLPR